MVGLRFSGCLKRLFRDVVYRRFQCCCFIHRPVFAAAGSTHKQNRIGLHLGKPSYHTLCSSKCTPICCTKVLCSASRWAISFGVASLGRLNAGSVQSLLSWNFTRLFTLPSEMAKKYRFLKFAHMRYSKYSLLNIFSAFARSLPFCHINHIPTAAAATSAMTPPIFPKIFNPKATKIKASSNAFITAIK